MSIRRLTSIRRGRGNKLLDLLDTHPKKFLSIYTLA